MVYAGLLIGVWYELLHWVARWLLAGKILQGFLDVVFALGMMVLLIGSMVLVNYGEFRVFCLLGAASGFVLYAWTLRPLLQWLADKPLAWAFGKIRAFFRMPWAKKVFR